MTQFTKSDIERALQTPESVSRAIEILGNNQREDELSSRSTNAQNGIGFTSCWASAGTHLWQFVTGYDARTKTNKWGRKCLSHPNWQRAKIIRRKVHNNGCEDAVQPPVPQAEPVIETPNPEDFYEVIAVPQDKVDMAIAILKAAGIL